MPFTVQSRTKFDASLWAENKALSLNQFEQAVYRGFTSNFEGFWEVSGSDQQQTIKDADGVPILGADGKEQQDTVFVSNGSKHTTEEMQEVLDIFGAEFLKVKVASDKMIAYIESNGVTIPERYKSSPFNFTVDTSTGRIVLTGLNEFWAKKAE